MCVCNWWCPFVLLRDDIPSQGLMVDIARAIRSFLERDCELRDSSVLWQVEWECFVDREVAVGNHSKAIETVLERFAMVCFRFLFLLNRIGGFSFLTKLLVSMSVWRSEKYGNIISGFWQNHRKNRIGRNTYEWMENYDNHMRHLTFS